MFLSIILPLPELLKSVIVIEDSTSLVILGILLSKLQVILCSTAVAIITLWVDYTFIFIVVAKIGNLGFKTP